MDLIGDLLRSSLLGELGDDEARVSKVRAAAREMASSFRGVLRPLVPAAVLATFDEHTAADSTVLVAADEHLLGEWETFRAAFPDAPTEVLRAIAAAGVQAAAADESDILLAAWYTARNAVAQIGAGRWAQVLGPLVDGWEDRAHMAIEQTWVPHVEAVTVRMPPLQALPEGERIALTTNLRDEAAAVDVSTFQAFFNTLGPRFREMIDNLVDGSELLAGEAQRRAVGQIKEFAEALGGRLRDSLGAQQQAVTALHLRTDLMWWRQSRFSERLGCGYGDLAGAADVVIAAALDLHLRVPSVTPLSVEHVLGDLVAASVGDDVLRLVDLTGSEQASALPGDGDPVSPASLLTAVRHDVASPIIEKDSDVIPARAAVLLFRDLQARRLAAQPPTEPPAGEPVE